MVALINFRGHVYFSGARLHRSSARPRALSVHSADPDARPTSHDPLAADSMDSADYRMAVFMKLGNAEASEKRPFSTDQRKRCLTAAYLPPATALKH